jgi:hypothetical protein
VSSGLLRWFGQQAHGEARLKADSATPMHVSPNGTQGASPLHH